MLTKHVIEGFLQIIDRANRQLKDYAPSSHVYFLEARFALHELRLMLESPSGLMIEERLVGFLAGRWEKVLRNTDAQYLHDFANPANQVCIEIARELGRIRLSPFLPLLMPSLSMVKPEDYITSCYTDVDLRLQELILSDNSAHLMNVVDILEGAQEDGILKHNSLFRSGLSRPVVQVLSQSEINRLLSRDRVVRDAYEAVQTRVNAKLYGNTLGAALNRLIRGLRDGGAHRQGSEFDSGSDANAAIVEFSEFVVTLDEEIRDSLMGANKFDRFGGSDEDPKTLYVKDLWGRLARPEDTRYNNSIYCVELIAAGLEEILAENPWLYDTCSYKGGELLRMSEINASYRSAIQAMKEALPLIQRHVSYEGCEESDVCVNLIRVMEGIKNFPLTSGDIVYFLQQYASAEKKEERAPREIRRFLTTAEITHGLVEAKTEMTVEALQQLQEITALKSSKPRQTESRVGFFLHPKRLVEEEEVMLPPSQRARFSDSV